MYSLGFDDLSWFQLTFSGPTYHCDDMLRLEFILENELEMSTWKFQQNEDKLQFEFVH